MYKFVYPPPSLASIGGLRLPRRATDYGIAPYNVVAGETELLLGLAQLCGCRLKHQILSIALF